MSSAQALVSNVAASNGVKTVRRLKSARTLAVAQIPSPSGTTKPGVGAAVGIVDGDGVGAVVPCNARKMGTEPNEMFWHTGS